MIESNIIQWVDLGDSMISLDVYGKKKSVKLFNFLRILLNEKTYSVFFYIILKFFFFLQIMELCLTNIEDDKSDSTVSIMKYITKVLLLHEIVDDKKSYQIAVILNSVITIIIILCIVYMAISIRFKKLFISIPIHIFNIINDDDLVPFVPLN
ncbi:MAG: hypothetical protein MJ252_27160, partial [archaeon]|nr:hypothetical protein [archaeon]